MKKMSMYGATGVFFWALCSGVAAADVLDDFNAGDPVADFRFDDASGTSITDAVNSSDPALRFDDDSDIGAAATNGLGQFDASGKDNLSFAAHYLDTALYDSGRMIGLIELEWDFDETVFSPGLDEQLRLSMMSLDPRTNLVTAQILLQRTAANEVGLAGNANGDGATFTGITTFTAAERLLLMIDADLDNDSYSIHYSFDGGLSFLDAGSGAMDPTRGIESLQFALDNDFSDDLFLIDRIAFSYIPSPGAAMLPLAGVASIPGRRRTRNAARG